jgi:hypothetical protein
VRGLTLDAGALIAIDRLDRKMALLLSTARRRGLELAVPAGAVGQVWREGRTQARLARFLGSSDVAVVPLDDAAARAAGQLLGTTGGTDVIDASVVLCARMRRHDAVVTSDPRDISSLDPRLRTIRV